MAIYYTKHFKNVIEIEIRIIQTNALNVALGQLDWSLSLRRGITMDFFTNAVRGQASTDYHFDALEAAYKMKVINRCNHIYNIL